MQRNQPINHPGISALGILSRKAAMTLGCVLLLCACQAIAPTISDSPPIAEWEQFLRRHVHADGRIIDGGAGGISHSEGQGFGMLLAVHFRDRAAFDRLYKWTRKNLMVRDDGLIAWRWSPQGEVTDRNNATDGDIFVAWALMRAGARWDSQEYLDAGLALARAIKEKLIRKTPRGLLLLPGVEGFESNNTIMLNLSYWVFPAFAEFSKTERSPIWEELTQSGHKLLAEARFGRWGLPPNWLKHNGSLSLPNDREPRFGYDAIRIPLYLMWSGTNREAMQSYRAFWTHFSGATFFPAWTNLKDDSVDSHDAPKGLRAIAATAAAMPDLNRNALPKMDDSQPYYSDVLLLLVGAMVWERTAR